MSDTRVRALQIALTLTAFEFFGPILRDFGPSHAMNETWVGHARVHLVWLLGFGGLSGLANLWLVWGHPFGSIDRVRNLRLSAAWQSCNLLGFWISFLLLPAYGGSMTMPGIHMHVFGIDENVFAFAVLSVVMLWVWLALGVRDAEEDRASA
jgi:hypothetical protein